MNNLNANATQNELTSNDFISAINSSEFDSDKQNNGFKSIEDDPFYFESDTLALRNNSDYSCMLKTLILLESQRIKACSDLEKLIELKEKWMNDPVKYITMIAKKHKIDNENECETDLLPTRQKVYMMPHIDWNKYYDCVDLDDLEAIKNQTKQRTHSLRQTNRIIQQQEQSNIEVSKRSSSRSVNKKSNDEKESVRNYNKPWSVEEQRMLEELLLEFPPEDNEAQRWRKIATKLGSRTPLQVQSHCQKYFIKLAKAGLPIPGRMPNMKTYITKKGNRGGNRKSSLVRGACSAFGIGLGGGRPTNSRNNQINVGIGVNNRMVGRGNTLNEISSMWSSFNPPITMNDDQDLKDPENNNDEDQFYDYENDEEYDDLEENFEDYEEDCEESNSSCSNSNKQCFELDQK